MTVKDLKMMLKFYPEDAEIFVQTSSGKINTPDNLSEAVIENKPTALILTLKQSARNLNAV